MEQRLQRKHNFKKANNIFRDKRRTMKSVMSQDVLKRNKSEFKNALKLNI